MSDIANKPIADIVTMLGQNMTKLSYRDQNFAESLLRAYHLKRLSGKQWEWMIRLTERAVTPPEQKEAVSIGNIQGVVSLFDHASERGLRFPKIRLQCDDGKRVVLSLAGDRAKHPGSVNVTDGGSYGNNTWYGRIMRDGSFEPSHRSDESLVTLLKKLASEPAKVASAFGKITGSCCFCNKDLTDDRSLSVGYGPICADKWGLPWGE